MTAIFEESFITGISVLSSKQILQSMKIYLTSHDVEHQYNHAPINARYLLVNLIQVKKSPLPIPATSTNVEISPKIFMTLRFNPSATLVLNFKAIPNASLKLLNLN